MRNTSHPPATAYAVTRTALWAGAAVVRTRLGAGIAALILTLLARILARTEAAWDLFEEYDDEYEDEAGSYLPTLWVMGSAPHAAVFEAGLVPDWIFTSRNRGMHPKSARTPSLLRKREARAPPKPCAALC